METQAPAPSTPSPRRRTSRLRRAIQPLIAPEVFDFWASRVNRTWSWQRPLARVVAREAASSDSVTLWLAPNRHCATPLPGQHLNLGADLDGARVTRSYSPSAAGRGRIAITVKRVEGGRLSRWLCDEARVGQVLELGPAFGTMTLPDGAHGDWRFLAAGSGITPMMAMVRALAAQRMPVSLTLVYWTATRAQRCFVDELRALAASHPGFRVRFALTRDTPIAADEIAGRIDAVALDALLDGAQAPQVFACGPGGFVESARARLAPHAASFAAEAFSPPPRVAVDQGTTTLTLARSGRRLEIACGVPLLDALEAQGLTPAYGCRMGICNTCACAKTGGAVRHLPTGAIDAEPASALKLCTHAAAGPLTLDL